MEDVFGAYGDIVPQKDESISILLPHGSALAVKLLPYTIDPDKGPGAKPLAGPTEVSALDKAMGGSESPPIALYKDSNNDVYLNVFKDDIAKATKRDFQNEFDGMLKFLKVPLKTSGIENPGSAAAAAAQIAVAGHRFPLAYAYVAEPQSPAAAGQAGRSGGERSV